MVAIPVDSKGYTQEELLEMSREEEIEALPIKEQRFKLLFINLSVTVLTVDYYVSECDTYNP